MGPRPRGRGISESIQGIQVHVVLQWGRDRAVAEFCSPKYQETRFLSLQWGRDRAVAELTADWE